MTKLTFLGAVGTVTGSKYLLEAGDRKVLIDCGLFQGFKQLRLRNWTPLPVEPSTIDHVVLTHAHLDHSGYLPLLVRNGFLGRVFCSLATRDLCAILLADSGYLQEKDAEFANRHGFSKHKPALPLYTLADAEIAMRQFEPVSFEQDIRITPQISARLKRAGHILGAALVELHCEGRKIVFSGDLGRPNSATMVDPTPVEDADYLILESTYGDRRHDKQDPEDVLAEIINRTAARGGTVLIPSFAVGRTQTLLYHLYRLRTDRRIPDLPIYLDSPMAIDASELYRAHIGDHKLGAQEWRAACRLAQYVHTVEASKALNQNKVPKVVISASGMATGGRVLHHIKNLAPDRRNTILFAGFQAGGTRGQAMTSGAQSVKIHGQYVPIEAEVQNLQMLSAHADADEILGWLSHFTAPPKMTFLTHGEPEAADMLRRRIEEDLGWPCCVPDYRDDVVLR